VQVLTRGFCDAELWNLDLEIAKFAAPRLERFMTASPTLTAEENQEAYEKALRALRNMIADLEGWETDHKTFRKWKLDPNYGKRLKETHEGVDIFGEYLCSLNW
jgi:hypothetical protein